MAELQTIKKVLRWLADVTVGKELNQSLFDLWAHSFGDVDDEQLGRAAIEYAQANKYFPVPADLLRLIGKAPLEAGLAWAKLGEYLNGSIEYANLPQELKNTLQAMGGTKYVREQPNKDMRIAFFQIYESVAKDEFNAKMKERAMLKAPVLITKLLEAKHV